MATRALCVGVNKYPNPALELKGCVNDAKSWAAMLTEHYDFTKSDVTMLTDKRATKARVMSALGALLKGARSRDVLVFTNSSHGTYRAEEGGDETLYDEAICPYDCEDELIIDDDLRELFVDLPKGVRLTVISDSCHSGSATRGDDELDTPDDRRARFCDPRDLGLPFIDDARHSARPRSEQQFPESGMNELLLSGCRSDQYSYDARFGRRYQGAMSYFAQQLITESGYRMTYGQLHRQLVPRLRDGNYDQEPQLEGRTAFKRRQLFT